MNHLKSIFLKNYHAFENASAMDFQKLNIFIGQNNIGKTGFLRSLNIYLRSVLADNPEYDRNDFRDQNSQINLSFEFESCPENIFFNCVLKPTFKHEYNFPKKVQFPDIIMVHPIRHLKIEGDINLKNIDGSGFGRLLQTWSKTKMEELNAFIATVLDVESARLVVPEQFTKESRITLQQKNGDFISERPFSNIGTGIMECIILAIVCIEYRGSIICLEEPELHLHPTTQRQLIDFLLQRDNQYFITTHSAHIINTGQKDNRIQIFSIQQESGKSIVQPVSRDPKLLELLSEMGYQSADLMQTNFVIMVEGPSDEIYINFWIQKILAKHNESTRLIEQDKHYSFIRSGGNALYTKNANDIASSLLTLNKNFAAILDSDRSDQDEPFNDVREQIIAEFNKWHQASWQSDGREIENYISRELMIEVLKKHHSGTWNEFEEKGFTIFQSQDQLFSNFTDRLSRERKKKGDSIMDKIESQQKLSWIDITKVKVAQIITNDSSINIREKYGDDLEKAVLNFCKDPFQFDYQKSLEIRIKLLVNAILKANSYVNKLT